MPADDRLAALGNQLVQIHLALREQLDAVLDDLDDHRPGTQLRPLQSHCLAFCSALGEHHTREDGFLPQLAAGFPELAPAIEKLMQDHEFVADLLARVEALLGSLESADDVGPVRAELAGLSALLNNHFAYEERSLASVLNSARRTPEP